MDVHPPLAKLLLTLAGWLAGFDGEFDFKDIGKDYVEPGVPYVAMRLLPAFMGVMTVPILFLTLKAAGCRTMTATLGAGLIIFGEKFSGNKNTSNSLSSRKWPYYSVPPHSPRLSINRVHRIYRFSMDLLLESA